MNPGQGGGTNHNLRIKIGQKQLTSHINMIHWFETKSSKQSTLSLNSIFDWPTHQTNSSPFSFNRTKPICAARDSNQPKSLSTMLIITRNTQYGRKKLPYWFVTALQKKMEQERMRIETLRLVRDRSDWRRPGQEKNQTRPPKAPDRKQKSKSGTWRNKITLPCPTTLDKCYCLTWLLRLVSLIWVSLGRSLIEL